MTDRMPTILITLALLTPVATRAEAQGEQRYRLVEVGGSALPVQVDKGWRCRDSLTSATLTLGSDSLWSLQYTEREVCGDRAEVEEEHERGRYSVVADTIRFHGDDDGDDRDDDELELDELALATLAADGTLTGRLRDGRTTVVFRR